MDEAMRLFSERGYAATSVADIQTAAGLTAGSGALYKHFATKRDLLAEGIRRYVAALELTAGGFMATLPPDPAEALRLLADAVSAAMAGDRDVIRIGLRDLEQFPDLLEQLWDGLLVALYRELTGWLTGLVAAGRAELEDPAATAAVLVASLTYHRVLSSLIGHPPGDVPTQAYLTAWVRSATATVLGDRTTSDEQRETT